MIVFCEECGCKNPFPKPYKSGQKLCFTCESCGFQNSYLPSVRQEQIPPSSEVPIALIEQRDGILGTLVWESETGVLYHKMPATLKTADLEFMAFNAWNCFKEAQTAELDDVRHMIFFIDQRNILAQKTRDGVILVFCRHSELATELADYPISYEQPENSSMKTKADLPS